MFSKMNKLKSAFMQSPLCVNVLNLLPNSGNRKFYFTRFRTIFIDTIQRVVPFNSLVLIRDSIFKGLVGVPIFREYIVISKNFLHYKTTKSELPISCAYILISLPLFYFTLSTHFVECMLFFNRSISLPISTWAILDKFCIRTSRENSGFMPGLNGVVLGRFDQTIMFEQFCRNFFTDEFIYDCLYGTSFASLVYKGKDDTKHVTLKLKEAIDSILDTFKYRIDELEFLLAVDQFYQGFNSCCVKPLNLVLKLPARHTNDEVGLHMSRNCSDRPTTHYIFHTSCHQTLEGDFYLNTFLILTRLFGLDYMCSTDVTFTVFTTYGHGRAGNNEFSINIENVSITDVLNTWLSAQVRTQVSNANSNGSSAADSNNVFRARFGSRSFSTMISSRSSDGACGEAVGIVFYAIPVPISSYTIVYRFSNGDVQRTIEGPS